MSISLLVATASTCLILYFGDDPGESVAIPCPDDPTLCVAFAPDGRSLVTGGMDGTIRLWDTETYRQRGEFVGHEGRVLGVEFAPDGKTLASASADRTACLWDLQGTQLATLSHPSHVTCVAFSPDGRSLATGGALGDMTVRIWDVGTREVRAELRGHSNAGRRTWVSRVHFARDGQILASSGVDGTVRIWDVGAGREARALGMPGHPVHDLAISPDGAVLAAPTPSNGTIQLYDPADGKLIGTIFFKSSGRLAFSHDGAILFAVGEEDGRIQAFEVPSGKESAIYPGGLGGRVWGVVASPDGRSAAWFGEGKGKASVRLQRLTPAQAKEGE